MGIHYRFSYVNRKLVPLIIVVTAAAAGVFLTQFHTAEPEKVRFVEKGQSVATVSVEVADNKTERRRGLMFRESLCENCGMLFVYENADERAFWMKNTLIPLDIIFISEDEKVLNVETAYPEPNKSDSDLTRYRSDDEANYVLEVNAGFAEEKGIEKGTEVRLGN